jgi:hypothetical protein
VPTLNFCTSGAPITFTYQVQDGSGGVSTVATSSISVTCINDIPIAVADTATGTEDTNLTIPVLINDTDVDSPSSGFTITGLTQPTSG